MCPYDDSFFCSWRLADSGVHGDGNFFHNTFGNK